MDRYGHLFPGKEAEAIELLGSEFNRQESLRATGTTETDSGALHIAQHSARETVRFGASKRSNKCSALDQQESHLSRQNIEKTQRFIGSNEGSGGGIRSMS